MVWYVLIFYVLLGLLLLFLPYGKWVFTFGHNDFFSFIVGFSFETCLFFFVLLFVSFMIFVYGSFYMIGSVRLIYFFLLLFSFVMSMGGLIIFSGSILLVLIFWDFLGLSSFFLVLFYNNVVSRCGAMSTVFTNRIGDFCIFLFFNGVILLSGSMLSYQFFCSFLSLLLFISAFIKGGQYPFGSWLPKAMAAPTPVSCLVHSSTLVTAGVMLMDFYSYVSLSSVSLCFVFFVGFFTMVFSSLCSLVEEDAKKIVALSTMSQMGFCFMAIGCGLHYVSYIHMISHSFFKSLLFMQMGYLIFINLGSQDYRGHSCYGISSPVIVQFQVLVSVFCLCGLVFTSGFCSKDYFLSRFYYGSFNLFCSFFYFLGVFFTFCYCYRLIYLFKLSFSGFDYVGFSSKLFFYSCFFLVFLSVVFTFWWFYNFLGLPFSFNRFEYLIIFFYFFMLYVIFNYLFKYYVFEFKTKFFMDLYSRVIYKFVPNCFYFDYFILSLNYFLWGLFSVISFFFVYLLRGRSYLSIMVFLFFFVFFLFF